MVEQRKAKRFQIRLPMRILRYRSQPLTEPCETRNLSSRGVLFVSNASLLVGEHIEYLISLPAGRRRGGRVELLCSGKVVRAERDFATGGSDPTYAVAATLQRYQFQRPGQS